MRRSSVRKHPICARWLGHAIAACALKDSRHQISFSGTMRSTKKPTGSAPAFTANEARVNIQFNAASCSGQGPLPAGHRSPNWSSSLSRSRRGAHPKITPRIINQRVKQRRITQGMPRAIDSFLMRSHCQKIQRFQRAIRSNRFEKLFCKSTALVPCISFTAAFAGAILVASSSLLSSSGTYFVECKEDVPPKGKEVQGPSCQVRWQVE